MVFFIVPTKKQKQAFARPRPPVETSGDVTFQYRRFFRISQGLNCRISLIPRKFTFNPASLNDQMTFKECLDRFFEDAKTRIMKVTFQRYEQHAVYLYNTPLAKTKMSELKGVKIVEWIDWLKKHPTAKSLKRNSFVEELRCLKTVLFWYKNFLNEDLNVPITKKHKQFCFLRPKTPRRPDYFIKPEDAKKWVEWLKANRSNPVYWRIATFMLLTGTRVSEACGLKWDAVDLERSMIQILRRVSWDKINKNPSIDEVTKTTNSARLLILPKRLQALLSQMKKEAVSDLVFTDSKGELLKYNAIQSAFNAGFEALGLPWRSTHICRHTFATLALMETKNLSALFDHLLYLSCTVSIVSSSGNFLPVTSELDLVGTGMRFSALIIHPSIQAPYWTKVSRRKALFRCLFRCPPKPLKS